MLHLILNKDPFKTNNKEANFPEKVRSFLDDQALTPQIINFTKEKTHGDQQIKEGGQVLDFDISKTIRNEGKKTKQFATPDSIKLSMFERFTEKENETKSRKVRSESKSNSLRSF